jgi:hypothetical protein
MNLQNFCAQVLFVWLSTASVITVNASDLVLLPDAISLGHKGAVHSLIVEQKKGELLAGDVTSKAAFVSSNPAVAEVDAKGLVRALSNGETTISATIDGATVSAKVSVTGADKPFEVSFHNNIQPVLFKMGCNAGACHGAAAGKNGFKLSLRGFDDIADQAALTRQANGRRVSLADPEQSLMLRKPTMAVPHEGGKRFDTDSETYRLLLDWIRAGAPPTKANEPDVDHLEVIPASATLSLDSKQQVLVRAHYGDGHYEDVTRWVKFGTTDESVVLVDDLGMTTVQGPGAASVTMWYASKVASARMIVPRPTLVAEEVYRNAERKNFVDDHVLAQLQSLQIVPSAGVNDTDFVRRAYLDATGTLPDSAEAFAFVMDADANKRSKLIDRLLESPQYVDYWTYKWSDLLLLSSKNLPQKDELNAFYRFIRESVAKNKPWDAFARDIVTATGSTTENGATNYFVMHKETTDLTETTSQAFLGMSVTCARCHNHPLEKWTLNDYYGMANLFSRVKIKGGKGAETMVLAQNFGNIVHPKLGTPMPPKPLDGKAISVEQESDRREFLAQWLTSPENPYFTRAIVNRVWKNYMGRGLVEPEDDLRLTNPASNEDLLNALAKDFADNKFDLKHLMRTIMSSAAYQRASAPSDPKSPDTKYYSQYIVRRLNAEVILDAYSHVTGVPTDFPGYPGGTGALQLPDSQVASYFLAAFGRPNRVQTCSCERTQDSNVAQTLHVANGETLNGKLRNEKSIVGTLAKQSDEGVLNEIYLRALSRYPNEKERGQALAILASVPKEGEAAATERRQAVEDLAWAVLSGKEFLFNH